MPRDPPKQQEQGLQSPCLGTSRSGTGCHRRWRQNGDGRTVMARGQEQPQDLPVGRSTLAIPGTSVITAIII